MRAHLPTAAEAADPPAEPPVLAPQQQLPAEAPVILSDHQHGPGGASARSCRHCHGPLPPRDPHKVGSKPQYCSPTCRDAAGYERRHGPATKEPKSCAHCSKTFVPEARQSNMRFCSAACRDEASRAKNPSKRRHRFPENPAWQRTKPEARTLALRVELDGRLRELDRAVYERGRTGCN